MEYRLQVAWRRANNLEHIGGGGLLLQRFAQLVQQPRVLDGDDGLGGKVLDELDLLVRDWLHLGTTDCEHTDGLVLPQQRDGQNRPVAKANRRLTAIRELVSRCLKVVDVDRRTIDEGTSTDE